MIYRAIVSLVSGLDGASAAFPNVVLVNHSICDEYAPSVKRSSQWGFSLNIAIRTLTLGKNGSGVYGVGGGMVLDSKAGLKWNECQWKSRVLGNVSSEGWREANHCKLACVTH
ncbi:chorismate-binding protein [Burkholderia sp. AU42008]|nr:chorismate-binding protein [Burkholderia sp. AU32357]MBY4876426.1 chorismate-binding protein [Burkholderia sp. AU42008]RQU05673.1 hypothetical protein DF152_33805 [Burkholderia cenocepacia]RQU12571.1 hypothetical protein DF153_32755 [Burkholderia cenocepacia]